jgi:branched-chain amino acid transport system ATP-binding protein
LLSVVDLTVSYGPIRAVQGVSMELHRGEVIVLAGSNGAGKTTLMRAIAGLVPASGGEIVFEGERLSGWPAHRVAARGLRYVPEGRRLWPGLSVHEHLQLAWQPLPAARRRTLRDEIAGLFPRLAARWHQPAGKLSGGEQQMLAIARGLASDPTLLMVDELSLGLAPVIVHQLYGALGRIVRAGVTLVVIEQALHEALALASRGYVLETGRLVVAGTAAELRASETVRKAYLGL